MRLLALDQALVNTGAAFFEGDDIVRTAEISLSRVGGVDYLHEQANNLRGMIRLFQPGAVALEDIHVGSDEKGQAYVKTALSLAQLLGAMKLVCLDEGLRVVLVSSSELITYLYGAAVYVGRDKKKAASIAHARVDLRASPRYAGYENAHTMKLSDHLADAINIGRVAIGKLKEEQWIQTAQAPAISDLGKR